MRLDHIWEIWRENKKNKFRMSSSFLHKDTQDEEQCPQETYTRNTIVLMQPLESLGIFQTLPVMAPSLAMTDAARRRAEDAAMAALQRMTLGRRRKTRSRRRGLRCHRRRLIVDGVNPCSLRTRRSMQLLGLFLVST